MDAPHVELAVIGGGITGLGVARLAARNGIGVVVMDRGDLASGASSSTSHMLHGGLRYLEHGHFPLVREALAERAALRRMAPELARPTRFLIPFYAGDRRPPWVVRAGLTLYDALAGRANLSPHTMVGARDALALEPDLEPRGLRGAALYSDAVMDDSRLAVAVARDAARHGAEIYTYTAMVGARPARDGAVELIARDTIDGSERRWVARAVINAAGPWADAVRTTLSRGLRPGAPDPARLLRPTRGTHLVYPALTRGHGLLLFARSDGRVFFLVPFADHTLVGTTEVETSSPPAAGDAGPSHEEIAYLRDELARILPRPAGQPVLALTAGLRPLLGASGEVRGVSREHRVVEDGPLITVVGGKYTTFRVMARDALERAKSRLGRAAQRLLDPVDPLPRPFDLDATSVEGLAETAAADGFARRVEDVVRRRSTLWVSPDRGRVAASAVATALARRFQWTPERTRDEIDAYHVVLERERALLEGAHE